jgi:formylglycine-generating enzyme required for sulfatase activity
MNTIRILFAPENIGIAERIASALAASGYDADASDAAAAAAVVIWSPAAAASPAILSAARAALARRVLVPVALNKAPPPPSFEHLWPMDLAGWNGQVDDPRWRFVLDEIELAVRRGVDLAPAKAPASIAPAVEADVSAGAGLSAPAARPILKKRPRQAAPVDDIFAELPGYLGAPAARPRPRVPRIAAIGAVFALALAGSAVFLSLKPSFPPPQATDAPPVIAFVEPKNQPADEAPPAEDGDRPPNSIDVGLSETQGSPPEPQSQLSPESEAGLLPESTEPAPEVEPISTAEALREGSPPAISDQDTDNNQGAERLLPAAPDTLGETLAKTEIAPDAPTDNLPAAPELIAPEPSLQIAQSAADTAKPVEPQGDADPIAELAWQSTGASAPEAVSLGLYLRDCVDCPDLAEIDPGVLTPDAGADSLAAPVMIRKRIAIAVKETTFDDWAACVADGACAPLPDNGWGREKRPVINVSWGDTQAYVQWLSAKTGKRYRLPSETEWEYAARAGSRGAFSFGQGVAPDKANYDASRPYQGPAGAARARTLPTASFAPNLFGLYDMHGNVAEWTDDCWSGELSGETLAPTTVSGLCSARVIKGGAWNDSGADLRASSRRGEPEIVRRNDLGFRVVRDLD